jgi:hypothetical protein
MISHLGIAGLSNEQLMRLWSNVGGIVGPFSLDSVEGECDAGKGIQVAANVK